MNKRLQKWVRWAGVATFLLITGNVLDTLLKRDYRKISSRDGLENLLDYSLWIPLIVKLVGATILFVIFIKVIKFIKNQVDG